MINIPSKNIKTHFCLLKRTAKTDKIEIFEVSSGEIRINNSLKVLNACVNNINKNFWIKNRLNCSNCEFFKTEHCREW